MYPQKFLNFEKVLRIDYYFIFLILIISHFTHTCRYIQQFHIVKDSFYFYSMWNTRSRGTRQIYQIHQIFRVQSHGEISFLCVWGGGWIALAFVRKFIPGRKDGAHGILGCIKIQDSLTGTRNSRRQWNVKLC